jgi:hypothetical protein
MAEILFGRSGLEGGGRTRLRKCVAASRLAGDRLAEGIAAAGKGQAEVWVALAGRRVSLIQCDSEIRTPRTGPP